MSDSSDLHSVGAQVGENGIDALLVDQAQAGIGQAQRHPAVLAFDPELAALQVRHEEPLGLVVRMRNVVTDHRVLARYLADFRHDSAPARLNFRTAGDYTVMG